MPKRSPADHNLILSTYQEVGSGRETARRLNIHENTVYQVLKRYRGLCRSCSNTVAPGKVHCPTCSERLAERAREKRKDSIRAGLCMVCDQPRDPLSRQFCRTHRLAHLERNDTHKTKLRSVHGGVPTEAQRERWLRGAYGDAAVTVWRKQEGRCLLCGVHHTEKAVHIHHIDHDRQNATEENMACLCQRCHWVAHRLADHPNPQALIDWVRNNEPELSNLS